MADLTADDLIYGYTNGIFPMADPDEGKIYWYSPDPRAIIPIDTYKPSKSLRPILNKGEFEIKINGNFEKTIRSCAHPRFEGDETWISEEIIDVYIDLHRRGFAHSIEAYQGHELVGGLYGVAIGSVFFGESMFYTVPNASKVAFHYLIQTLKKREFVLLDTQFINDNVKRYGAIEISKNDFLVLLKSGLSKTNVFIEDDFGHFLSI